MISEIGNEEKRTKHGKRFNKNYIKSNIKLYPRLFTVLKKYSYETSNEFIRWLTLTIDKHEENKWGNHI